MATSSSEDCSVILVCVDMNHFKYNTDGLGGHYGLACSLELGVARGVTKHRFHLLFLSMMVMCMGSPMSLQIPLHSLILNIQRSNELYKNIKFPYIRRLKIHQNIFFSNLLVLILLTSDLILWGSMLILQSGDVEVNSGPESAEDTSFTSDDQSLISFETLSNHLSVFHLNIQSLVPKK